jgi:pimeloyl-ACP methyl ester carboxylesterase
VRRPAKIAVTVIAMYLTLSLAFGILMARLTLCPMRLPLPDRARIACMYKPYGGDLQTVAIQAADGVVLQGWYIVPEHQNGQAVILLHGIGDNRGGVAGYGQAFQRQGYRILLPDSRAHGESGGTVATYGLLESDDVRRWVSWLYGKGARCVDGFGESMGAALVLESLRSESRFCAVVADSPFSDFRSVAYDREGYFVGAGCFRMERIVGRTVGLLSAEIGLLYARWRYGVDLRRANRVDAVKSSTVPVLLIHGEEDINILPWHSRTLAQADPSHAQLWLVPGAGHCGAVGVAPDEFWSRVLGFFARHNGAQPETVSYLRSFWPSIAIISKNKSPGLSLQGCWLLTSDSTDTACLLYRRAVFPRCQAYLWEWSPRRAADSNRG